MKKIFQSKLAHQLLGFVAVGLLNTALNFLILNLISKGLLITQGWLLGTASSLGFLTAVVQSYFWNKAWTFGNQNYKPQRHFVNSILVGGLGVAGLWSVFFASGESDAWYIYGLFLVVFLSFEFALWKIFSFPNLKSLFEQKSFPIYFLVSLIGLIINFILVSIISTNLHIFGGDLDKNLSAVLATVASLAWNFIGYKLFVFKQN